MLPVAELPAQLLAWARAKTGTARVVRWTAEPIAGGTVSDRVERITLYLEDDDGAVRNVRVVGKHALPHEIAGLRLAQAVRPAAAAIPELIAWGSDPVGPWLVSEHRAGQSLRDRPSPVPAALFDSLARLHARYHAAVSELADIPRVDAGWWRHLCLSWVLPQVADARGEPHPAATRERAVQLVTAAADEVRVGSVLARLTPTLLHGDVHPSNVLVNGGDVSLIDWGSSRVGPAMLDLANLVGTGSGSLATYRCSWQRLTGQPIDAEQVELGYRWADLQIPTQYLPWMMRHRPTAEVTGVLDRIERATAAL